MLRVDVVSYYQCLTEGFTSTRPSGIVSQIVFTKIKMLKFSNLQKFKIGNGERTHFCYCSVRLDKQGEN